MKNANLLIKADESGEILLPPQELRGGFKLELRLIPIKSRRNGQVVRFVVHSKKLLEGGVGRK